MRNFNFAAYWHSRHIAKPDLPNITVEELISTTGIPEWVVNADADVLTADGAHDASLTAPIAPGIVIQKALDHLKMTQSELAHNLNISRQLMSLMIHNERNITLEHALRLEQILSIPAHVLLRLQADYQLYRHYRSSTNMLTEKTK